MLVLSRKESERIRLGDSIVITVVRTSADKVRLGIEAPPEVKIMRKELLESPQFHRANGREMVVLSAS